MILLPLSEAFLIELAVYQWLTFKGFTHHSHRVGSNPCSYMQIYAKTVAGGMATRLKRVSICDKGKWTIKEVKSTNFRWWVCFHRACNMNYYICITLKTLFAWWLEKNNALCQWKLANLSVLYTWKCNTEERRYVYHRVSGLLQEGFRILSFVAIKYICQILSQVCRNMLRETVEKDQGIIFGK